MSGARAPACRGRCQTPRCQNPTAGPAHLQQAPLKVQLQRQQGAEAPGCPGAPPALAQLLPTARHQGCLTRPPKLPGDLLHNRRPAHTSQPIVRLPPAHWKAHQQPPALHGRCWPNTAGLAGSRRHPLRCHPRLRRCARGPRPRPQPRRTAAQRERPRRRPRSERHFLAQAGRAAGTDEPWHPCRVGCRGSSAYAGNRGPLCTVPPRPEPQANLAPAFAALLGLHAYPWPCPRPAWRNDQQ
mmetsp:Transcript_74523/g.197950  ORF Transcript_74523/g.197950 Transcript_74523/m.197950 type:complete len:241 (-) Transcript_74523:59-781(-)